MSYLYAGRKREPAASDREPKRNTAPDQARSVLPGRQAISGKSEGQSRRLDAAMRERMNRTFGDLSALRDWQPPVPEAAPAPTAPYTGPVTHTLSDASPSPAAAGPMQAFRGRKKAPRKVKPRKVKPGKVKTVKPKTKPSKKGRPITAAPETDLPNTNVPSTEPQGTRPPETNLLNLDVPSTNPQGTEPPGSDPLNIINEPSTEPPSTEPTGTDTSMADQTMSDSSESGLLTTDQSKIDHTKDLTVNYNKDTMKKTKSLDYRPGMRKAEKRIDARLRKIYGKNATLVNLKRPANPGEKEGVDIEGLMAARVLDGLLKTRGRDFDMGEEEIFQLMDNLLAPTKKGMNASQQKEANDRFDKGMQQYKGIVLDDLKHKEKQFGTLVNQMHPEDVLPQIGEQTFGQDDNFLQDAIQIRKMGGKYLDPGNKDDQKFIDLAEYYNDTGSVLNMYRVIAHSGTGDYEGIAPEMILDDNQEYLKSIQKMEESGRIKGPKMNPEQLAEYQKDLKQRAKTEPYLKNRLFGRYKK